MNEIVIPPHLLRRNADSSEFKPKLNEAERKEILALHLLGVRTDVLSLAYGLNRRTIGAITNERSSRYKEIRRERDRLGVEEFTREYATEEARNRIIAVSRRPELRDRSANPQETRKRGINVVKPEQCSYSHRLDVQYKADMDPPGWYYRDLDSKSDPNSWFHNGPDSLSSSQNCLALAEANLTDD